MRQILIILLTTLSISNAIDIVKYPVLSEKKLNLTKQFAKRHYGMETYHLIDPKMIVIHYTTLPSLRFVLGAYKEDKVDDDVDKLAPYGDINLGTHYVVDFDGTIYELVPTTVMVRHIIGYDYTAISIENVGSDASYLTEEQLEANAELIQYLTYKHQNITYMIGHMEYMNTTYPHYKLFKKLDEELHAPVKIDPGWNFLKDLRTILKDKYDIELKK